MIQDNLLNACQLDYVPMVSFANQLISITRIVFSAFVCIPAANAK